MTSKFNVNFASAASQFEKIIKDLQKRSLFYKTVFRGKGLEFDSYRNMTSDDDAVMIDWKSSLRANKILVKQYVEERDTEIYFLVDSSSSMLFGSGNKLKAEYAAEIVAVLTHLISNSNDRPGLILFSSEVKKRIVANRSKNQIYLVVDALSNPEYYGGKFNIESAVSYILKTINSKYAVIVIVSDFLNISDEKALKLLTAKFETFALMVRDPLDEKIPATGFQIMMQDPGSKRQILVDPSVVAEKYAVDVIKKKTELKEKFKSMGIDTFDIHTNESFPVPLATFLKNRTGKRS